MKPQSPDASPTTFPPAARRRGLLRRALLLGLSLALFSLGGGRWNKLSTANSAKPPATEAGGADAGASYPYTNRLADSNNPYLLLHAHNPVEWYPWGEEALSKARRENKPIFLSVGYSTCFWCHVAERLIYSNPDIAELMNRWFVNIKVDREQRPDVDETYMLATLLLAGHGGWPNNVFLTPDLKPFFAGSYFPPQDEAGRPGFPAILRSLQNAWATRHDEVAAAADRVYTAMDGYANRNRQGGAIPASISPRAWLTAAQNTVRAGFDVERGGFGRGPGPRFPQEPLLKMLLEHERLTHDRVDREILVKTLDELALGGVHDHLAGGFHRYSTESTWSVPHFEKMLYDNAQLLEIYAQAYAQFGNPLYRYVAEGTLRYLLEEMRAPHGAFYTAQDAEVDGSEGASYVWTEQEIRAVLGADAERFLATYALTPLPPAGVSTGAKEVIAEGAGVLRIHRSLVDDLASQPAKLLERLDSLAPLRAKLLAARKQRPQPLRDEKEVVALNALVILALERSAPALERKEFADIAAKAAASLWDRAWDAKTGSLRHEIFQGHAQTAGYLDDYALLGRAMLAIYRRTQEKLWLNRASALASSLLTLFMRDDGRLFSSASASASLIQPLDDGDQNQPSGTSAAIGLLLELGRITQEPRFQQAARKALGAVSAQVEQQPPAWSSLIGILSGFSPEQPLAIAAAPEIAQDSANVVTVRAARGGTAQRPKLVVTLRVGENYHINANPASLDYLIPTTVTLAGQPQTTVYYPPPKIFRPKFIAQDLKVYEGEVEIDLEPAPGTGERDLRGAVRTQACTDEVCLPPATLEFAVPE